MISSSTAIPAPERCSARSWPRQHPRSRSSRSAIARDVRSTVGRKSSPALRPTAFSDGQPYRRSAPALHAVTTPSASVATTASSRGAVDAETPPGHSSGAPCAASLGEGLVAT
jgi:hypothetical protein